MQKYTKKYGSQLESWGPFANGKHNIFKNQTLLNIGSNHNKTAAQKLNLTEYTVQGLIPTIKRNYNNERIFDNDSVEWLYGCKMLRSTGISIKQIKRYVDLCMEGNQTVNKRYYLMINQRK